MAPARLLLCCACLHALAAAVRAPQDSVQRFLIHELPADLSELGQRIFGSRPKLEAFVKNLHAAQDVNLSGLVLSMVSSVGDNTIERLNREMAVDEYHVRDVSRKDGAGVIVDVGSNIGDMTIAAAKLHPDFQVIALEPVPSTYFLLRLNMRINEVKELRLEDVGAPGARGVCAMNSALTDDARDVEISYSVTSTQDAVTSPNSENPLFDGSAWSTATVRSIALPSFMRDHHLDSVDLLKMDCEGCEFEAIPSMEADFVDKTRIKKFVAEIHQSVFDHSIDDVRAAARPSDSRLNATNRLLQKRGCAEYSWKVAC